MEYINSLPSNVTEIDIKYEYLYVLPDDLSRFTWLQKLDCSYGRLTRLDNLPLSLRELYCSYNELTQLELQKCFAFFRSLRDNILFRFAKQYIIGGQFTLFFTSIRMFRKSINTFV